MDKCILPPLRVYGNDVQSVGALEQLAAALHRLWLLLNRIFQIHPVYSAASALQFVRQITRTDDTGRVFKALTDLQRPLWYKQHLLSAASEELAKPGTSITGKMAALRRLGFDKVFDTDFAADLTIMEEGTEPQISVLSKVDTSVKLPLLTSCCLHDQFLRTELSGYVDRPSAKSPQQMFGAVAKNCC